MKILVSLLRELRSVWKTFSPLHKIIFYRKNQYFFSGTPWRKYCSACGFADERLSPYVHSVLSISTPHFGTILGDYVFEQYYSGEDFETPFTRWIIDTLDFAPTRRNYIKELTVGRWMHPLLIVHRT